MSSSHELGDCSSSTASSGTKVPACVGEKLNRPFYRYGDHIELIQFKEYYRMPRGHEHILFVFSSAFGRFFLKVFFRIRF